MREETKTTIALVIKYLRAGKSPKEISYILGIGWEAVKAILHRHKDARMVYIETHSLRHPNIQGPPHKIINPIDQMQDCNVK